MVVDTLEDVKIAIEAANEQRVSELVDPVHDRFEQRREKTEAIATFASRLSEQAETVEAVQNAVEEYFTSSSEARRARLEVNRAVLGYLNGSMSKDRAASVVGDAIEAESRLTKATEDVTGLDMDVEVPPVLTLAASGELEIPKRTPIAEMVSVTNWGDRRAVEPSVEIESSLSVEPVPSTLDDVAPGETAEVELAGTPESTGAHEVAIEVVAGDARARAEIEIVVADRTMYLDAARTQIRELQSLIGELQEQTGGPPHDGLTAIENKLRTADKRLGSIIRAVEQGVDEDAVENRIEAVVNLLETVGRQARALSGKQLTDGTIAIISRDAEGVVETLEAAINAGQ